MHVRSARDFFLCTLEAPEICFVFLCTFASHCDFLWSDLTKINGDISMINPMETAIHIILPMILRCALLSLTSISINIVLPINIAMYRLYVFRGG